MGHHHANPVFARLGQDDADIGVKIILRLVDVDHGGQAVLLAQHGAFLGRLRDQGDEEPAKDLGALFLQERL